MPELQPGTRVTSTVELVRPLGKGGMGSVWVAYHEALDTEVAVKFVATEEASDTTVMRFKREAALSAKLKSPHTVKTFDHGVMDDGQPYIVMELLEGETLGARLAREGALALRDVVVIVGQVAQVLDEAHALSIIHRDIKPDNIFLIESGYDLFVKVLDFGIAKSTAQMVSAVTDTGAIVGTPEYMSPEQLLDPKSVDQRTDLWALAVVAYHALVGRTPFRGETLPSLSLSICNAEFEPATAAKTELPPELDPWFDQAFDPDPKARWSDALTFANALREVARDSTSGWLGARPGARRRRPRSGESAEDSAHDSGVRASVPDADADQSGRRLALAETTPTTPTFSGSAAELAVGEKPVSHRRKLFAAAVAALAVALVAGRLLVQTDVAPANQVASSPAEPTASGSEAAPTPSSPSTSAVATAFPESTATDRDDEPTAAEPTATPVVAPKAPPIAPRPVVAPKPPPAPVEPTIDCDQDGLYLGPDGKYKVRAECL